MRGFRFLVLAIATAGGVLLAPSIASAHALRADVTVGKEVKVLAYFDDETPAEQATVTVLDANGKEILTGKTNERGEWTFAKPAPGQYTMKVECIGHIAKVSFPVQSPTVGGPETPPVVYTASAHGFRTDVTVGKEVKVLAYFSDEKLADNATVTVLDVNGKEILTGKTNERGEWTFAKPAPGQYTLQAKHNRYNVKVSFSVQSPKVDEPEVEPAVYTGWRIQKPIGITVGLVLLLGISALSWFLRRQRRG